MEEMVGIKQQVLSRLENPYYGKATLTTLKKIAAGCDVGLLVEFVPYSQLVNRVSGTPYTEHGYGPETMNVPSFEEEEKRGAFDVSQDAASHSGEDYGTSQYLYSLLKDESTISAGAGSSEAQVVIGGDLSGLIVGTSKQNELNVTVPPASGANILIKPQPQRVGATLVTVNQEREEKTV
jgi:hypothetical protein